MTQHAILSASGAPRWMRCLGSVALGKDIPDRSSKYADEGTAAHEVAQMCLVQGQDASAFAGRRIEVARGEGAQATSTSWEVNEEMVEAVQRYVDIVRGLGGELMVEQRVDFGRWIGVEDSFGTSDALVVIDNEMVVCDLKYGKGVRVEAEDNEQLMLYALGCLDLASLAYDIETVRLMIVQPRIPHVSEHVMTVAQLEEFASEAKVAAAHAIYQYNGGAKPDLNPGEKQCRFCKAKGICPAAAKLVFDTTSRTGPADPADFADLEVASADDLTELGEVNLAEAMAKVEFIEQWCTAVRAETERRLFEGKDVPGFKLVQGRKGPRAWTDPAQVEAMLKGFRLKAEQMFDFKLISPATAEKLATAGVLGPRQWSKVEEAITQAAGKPSVAPVTDKRPAIQVAVTAEDFADMSSAEGLV